MAFLPIGLHHQVAFDASGALLTDGLGGSHLRFPIEAVGSAGTLRVGPRQPLPFPSPSGEVASNRDGCVTASAHYRGALVRHADVGNKLIPLGQQDDVGFVAVSPDGNWIATGSHSATDVYVKIWEARSGLTVACEAGGRMVPRKGFA